MLSNLKNKLKLGIIIDEKYVTYDIYNLIKNNSEFYKIETLFINETKIQNQKYISKIFYYLQKRGLKRLIDRTLFQIIFKIEKLIFNKFILDKNVFNLFEISKINIKKEKLKPIVSKSGYVYRYSKDDINIIKKNKLDILIRGGSGILRGEILNVCKYGIISFHHGNNDQYRGGPPGFWEVYERNHQTGFILQQLTEELDGGKVIFKGNIATIPIYIINYARILSKSYPFLIKVIEHIGKYKNLPKSIKSLPYKKKIYKLPSFEKQIIYIFKTSLFIIRKVFLKFLNLKLFWNINFYTKKEKNSHLRIKNPKNGFFADPFIISKGRDNYCFVEKLDYSENKGKIHLFNLREDSYKSLGTVLEEKFHLSYPYILKVKNNFFMCPESSNINEIRLYKANNFPKDWVFYKTLIRNISAADTNIIYYKNKWWLFSNVDTSKLKEHDSELHIFYSDKFDSSEWIPHQNNPVIFDSNKARNAGKILQNNGLFRVCQTQGIGINSKRIKVSKIIKLSESEYVEEEILNNVDVNSLNEIVCHSFSENENYIAYDFVLRKFNFF